MDIHFDTQIAEILKWVFIVFAAGFIGYFGRYLSMLIIEKVRKRRDKSASSAEPVTRETSASPAATPEESNLKLEKKRIKLEKKKAKRHQKETEP